MSPRRPLIDQYDRPWGVSAAVQDQQAVIDALLRSERTGDVVQNFYPASGGGGGSGGVSDHGALSGLTDIDHPFDGYDAIVDSDDPRAGTVNVYATLEAARAAGHNSIFFRKSTDAVDITIGSGDGVTRIVGDTAATAAIPVNIICNKTAVLFEALGFNNVTLTLAGIQDRAFACLFSGTIVLGTADADGAIIAGDTSMPYDGGANGGLATWGAKGFGRVDNEYISWNAGGAASNGTLTGTRCKGFFWTRDTTHSANAQITAIDKGSLNVIANDIEVTACFFVGCDNPDAQCVYVDSTARAARVTACVFVGNSTLCGIAVANRDQPQAGAPQGFAAIGDKFGGNSFGYGCVAFWDAAGLNSDEGVHAPTVNGCTFADYGTAAIIGAMRGANLSGNIYNGQLNGATVTHTYRVNQVGGIDASTTTIPFDTKSGAGDLPLHWVIRIDNEYIAYSARSGLTSGNFTDCIRGFNGSTPATHADDAVITPVDWISLAFLPGSSGMALFPNVIGGSSFSSRNHHWQHLYGPNPLLAQTNAPVIYNGCGFGAGFFSMGAAFKMIGCGFSACTMDVRNNGLNCLIMGGDNIAIQNADQFLTVWQPQATPGEMSGVGSQTRLPDGREIAWGITAGDRVPGSIPLVNRSGVNTVLGQIVIFDTANDYSFTRTTTGGNVLRAGIVVQAGVADGSDAFIATADGTVCDILCNGTVNRGEYLETSTTAGEARSTGSTTKGATSIARALQARSGAGSSLIRCVIEK